MISKCTDKHIIKIAGPGGGKTYSMIQDIKDKLKGLESYRNLVVITYTNSATEEIQSRLSKEIDIPENVFIGTIHSFLIKFIVNPYSGIFFDNIPNDKIYTDYDLDKFDYIKRIQDPQEKNIEKSRIKKILQKKGIISFDDILDISNKIVKDSSNKKIIAEKISKKIKYLFIDEYQDVCNKVYDIVEEIRKAKYTHIYCVGDPEQYIDSYRSSIRNYQNIPFLKTLNKPNIYSCIKQVENYRSNESIVEFINKFNCHLTQISQKCIDDYPVLFIESVGVDAIVNEFKNIELSTYKREDASKFYIVNENNLVKELKSHVDIKDKTSDEFDVCNGVNICLEYIKKISVLNNKKIMEQHNIDVIELRMLGMKLLKFLIANRDIDRIKAFVEQEIKINISNNINFESVTKEILSKIIAKQKKDEYAVCTTIHKSKGLEADMVLVIAKNNNELSKWLELNREKRCADISQDVCRRGFVAFSRARELLVISCKEGINEANQEKLKSLNAVSHITLCPTPNT